MNKFWEIFVTFIPTLTIFYLLWENHSLRKELRENVEHQIKMFEFWSKK